MERLDWIGGEGFEALRGQRAALVDGPVYTLLDPTEYAVAVGEGDWARLVIVHTKPESATLSIDVGENAKLSIVEMFIDEAFVECSIRQQGGSLCECFQGVRKMFRELASPVQLKDQDQFLPKHKDLPHKVDTATLAEWLQDMIITDCQWYLPFLKKEQDTIFQTATPT